MSDMDKEPQDKAGRWIRIALFLSLALNLLIVGLILGARMGGHPMRPGFGPDVGFGPLTQSLSREDRRALRDRMEAARPDVRAEREAMRQDLRSFAEILQAEPWDRAAAEALLTTMGARTMNRLDTGRAVFLDYVDGLDPEARRALGTRIAKDLPPQP